ncbi:histidinol-phosphate aminotransferase [Rubricella aquisinus]|uniref:Histidinol-phosphate aminotransferase n=1 Tax=Rubricella aquisinus TaxID=2028108 RepID=A0A840WJZ7_9RHOB|nr:pyridoxal phosphate-dependent aminotransferase [Rubricella aquisinus]MBB5515418.1 histidinol-phosphate aminotransferase [Rubricella aquisinus]
MADPRYTDLVQSLPATVPFVGPEAQERAMGQGFRVRLGANESVFGPSPDAVRAMATAAGDQWMYADPESHDLKAALADHLDVTPAHIVVGEGIDGLLGLLVRLLIGPGDAVVTSAGAYPTFNYHVVGFGGVIHAVPYVDDMEDPESLVAKARDVDAKLIYIANPDNPMGGVHGPDVIAEMIAGLPEGAVLCLDEAYGDFVDDLLPLELTHPRVIRMRTFSKAYGMAGARVGYGLAHPDFVRAFDKVRNHFGMNRASQIGALAALQDQIWLGHVKRDVAIARDRIGAIAAAHGLRALPSATNFVTVDMGGDGDLARAMVAALGKRGVFVRMPFVAPQDRCIRISAGRPAQLDVLEEVFGAALAEAQAAK